MTTRNDDHNIPQICFRKTKQKQGPEKLAKIISFLHKNFLLLCFPHNFFYYFLLKQNSNTEASFKKHLTKNQLLIFQPITGQLNSQPWAHW